MDQKPAAPNLEWIGVLCEHLSLGVIYITCATGLNSQHLERKETKQKKRMLTICSIKDYINGIFFPILKFRTQMWRLLYLKIFEVLPMD